MNFHKKQRSAIINFYISERVNGRYIILFIFANGSGIFNIKSPSASSSTSHCCVPMHTAPLCAGDDDGGGG